MYKILLVNNHIELIFKLFETSDTRGMIEKKSGLVGF